MGIFAIWIDRGNAKIFHVARETLRRKNIQASNTNHHAGPMDKHCWAEVENHFFSEVISAISNAQKILILGPGVMKHHFLSYLQEHYPSLGKKVVGCETVDHPTDPQIVTQAQKFFLLPKLMPLAK